MLSLHGAPLANSLGPQGVPLPTPILVLVSSPHLGLWDCILQHPNLLGHGFRVALYAPHPGGAAEWGAPPSCCCVGHLQWGDSTDVVVWDTRCPLIWWGDNRSSLQPFQFLLEMAGEACGFV